MKFRNKIYPAFLFPFSILKLICRIASGALATLSYSYLKVQCFLPPKLVMHNGKRKYLTISMLCKLFSRRYFDIFSLFFQANRL